MNRGKQLLLGLELCFVALGLVALPFHTAAMAPPATAHSSTTDPADFNLQVTPSPLVLSVKPGIKTQSEIKIRNGSSGTENLKIEARAFSYSSTNGQIDLKDTPADISNWVSFSAPTFTMQSGQWLTQTITFNTPKTAGFSYSFALVIGRQSNPSPAAGTRLIKGSVAIFSLVNVDRPDATSKLEVVEFKSNKHLYEYLPATFSVRFKNTGNTILQPYGNVFIQRGKDGKNPLATLKVNESKGYILPNTARTVSAAWNDGFATYQSSLDEGDTKKQLTIDWSKLSHFRIGRYTAHLVAVYNDGKHDVPIEGTVTFWVIPWRAILIFILVIVLLWLLIRWQGKRRTDKAVKRALAAQAAALESAKQPVQSKPEEKL